MNRLAGCQMRLDAFEGGEGYPAVVVADLDVGVAGEGLVDGDLGALVEGEELGAAAVG